MPLVDYATPPSTDENSSDLVSAGMRKDEKIPDRTRSMEFHQVWQAVNEIMASIHIFCRDANSVDYSDYLLIVTQVVSDFFEMVAENEESAAKHFEILLSSDVPDALVMLYMSSDSPNKTMAKDLMTSHFFSLDNCFTVDGTRIVLPKSIHIAFAPVVLEFCKLLRKSEVALNDPLYRLGRKFLGSLVTLDDFEFESFSTFFKLEDIFSFFNEIAASTYIDLSDKDICPFKSAGMQQELGDFKAFFTPLQKAFMKQVKLHGPVSVPVRYNYIHHHADEIESLHVIFIGLLEKMDDILRRMECRLASEEPTRVRSYIIKWEETIRCSYYLAILKELNGISKLYIGAEEQFWNVMKLRRVSVCDYIINHAHLTEDNQWLLESKVVTDFECRRHLVMKMFPYRDDDDGGYSYYDDDDDGDNDDYSGDDSDDDTDDDDYDKMIIDRSQLLVESFKYISRANHMSLEKGLSSMRFKNEKAKGFGVLREWFFLVCQAIFNPQNALFVTSANDHRRFYPNSASKVDPMHLEYFHFAGRVIALALMYKVQIGIVFDRVFFLQLAGMHVSLEDIKEADPYLYNSYKQIMEMDADVVDSDTLGLTFVREFEELGSRRVVELCPGGANMAVNSRNRGMYIHLLIQHQFVKSISEQMSRFAEGFADILLNKPRSLFFKILELEDLDCLLYGNENAICVKDWKAHTTYNGYKETDCQIEWFWKIVEEMSAEQRKAILFFWTSVKYLPVEGFRGLSSPLQIFRTEVDHDHLPTSHTCFFQLGFPEYPSKAVMENRLNIIIQEHVGASFGVY